MKLSSVRLDQLPERGFVTRRHAAEGTLVHARATNRPLPTTRITPTDTGRMPIGPVRFSHQRCLKQRNPTRSSGAGTRPRRSWLE